MADDEEQAGGRASTPPEPPSREELDRLAARAPGGRKAREALERDLEEVARGRAWAW